MEPLRITLSQGADPVAFTADVEWDPDTRQYVGIVRGVHGAHTQAKTLDMLQYNLKEVLGLCLAEDSEPTMEQD
jgi:predicted RNase H-like HicB family nuclease